MQASLRRSLPALLLILACITLPPAASAQVTVTFTANNQTNGISYDTTSGTVTFEIGTYTGLSQIGPIDGSGQVVINGTTGDLLLDTTNYVLGGTRMYSTYSGGTTINGGTVIGNPIQGTAGSSTPAPFGTGSITLAAGHDSALLSIRNSGTQTQTGIFNTIIVPAGTGAARIGSSTFNMGESNYVIFSGNLALNRPTTLVDAGATTSGRTTFSGVISGNVGTLSIEGGRVTMTNANTFTGDVVVKNNSRLQIESDNATPTLVIPVAANVTLQGSGTLSIYNNHTIGSLTGDAASTVSPFAGVPSTLTVGANNQSTTFAGAFQGALSVVKTGIGTLTLTGASTHSGTTTISAGTLELDNGGSLASDVVNNAALVFNRSDTSTFSSIVSGTGSLTKNGTGSLTLSAVNTYTGGTVVNGGSLTLGNGGAIGAIRGALTINSGATVVASTVNALGYGTGTKIDTVTLNGGTLNATAAGDQGWGVAYTLNGGTLSSNSGVSSSSAASKFSFGNSSSVTVGAGTSATIAGRVDLRGDLGDTTVNFTVGSGATLTTSAAITSSTGVTPSAVGLTKLGTGTLTLTGANTYTGNTTISAGLVEFNSAAALGAATNKVVLNGGGLRWATGTSTDISNRLDVLGAAGGTFDTNGNNVTFASAIAGTGSFTKNGTGSLTLNAVNTYTGGTVVNGGTLTLGNGGQIGAIRGALTINSGAAVVTSAANALGYGTGTKIDTVTLNGGTLNATAAGDQGWGIAYTLNGGTLSSNSGVSNSSAASKFSFGNSSSVTVGAGTSATIAGRVDLRGDLGDTTVNFTVGSGATLATSAAITSANGTVGLTKLGAGTMTLTGANTYTGVTTLSAGTLQFTKEVALYNNTPASWTAANVVVNSGATAAFNVGGTGEFTAGDLDTLKALGTASGGFKSGSFLGFDTTNASGGIFTYNSSIANPNGGANALGLVKLGAGTLVLGGTNTYSGDTFVNAGTLKLGAAGALSPNTKLNIAAGASFNANGFAPVFADLAGAGSIDVGSLGLSVAPSGSSSFTGTLSGSGGFTLTGSGTLTLGAANNYSGATVISNGTLQLGADGALPTSTSISLTSGGTLDLNGHAATLSSLSGASGTTLALTGSASLAVAQSGNTTFAGVFSGNGGLTKSGNGRLTLTGTNTYSGATSITGGEIKLNGSAANSAFTLSSGGTLSGNGTIGTLTIGSGGILSPGNSPGTTSAGNATWNGGGSYTWEINKTAGAAGADPGWDLLSISGALNITATSGSPFTINLTSLTLANSAGTVSDFNSSANYSFTFVSAGSISGFDTNAFALNTTGFSNPFTGTWSIGQSGNTLTLNYTGASAIPEPSTYAAIAGAVMLAFACYRRTRTNR